VQALIERVRKDDSEQVRIAALASLAFAGKGDAFEFLLGVLRDPRSSPALKRTAASGLESLSNQDFGEDAERWSHWYHQNQAKLGGP